jgi:hypothetical protein
MMLTVLVCSLLQSSRGENQTKRGQRWIGEQVRSASHVQSKLTDIQRPNVMRSRTDIVA